MVGVVRCGSGNIGSVVSAMEYLGADTVVVEEPAQIEQCERLVLPGVGSFREAMCRLEEKSFVPALNKFVLEVKRPVFGICLGMQLMAQTGLEGGETRGLGWFEGTVQKIQTKSGKERIPHVGWNELTIRRPHALLQGIPSPADFYFVHSYTLATKDRDCVVADCLYADGVTAIVARDNIFAVQFHPEKSQNYGLHMLENFLGWNPS